MKSIAILLNICAFVFLFGLVVTKGMPDQSEFFALVLVLGGQICSLIALLKSNESSDESINFIGLYLRRKTLEEQKKIDALRKS